MQTILNHFKPSDGMGNPIFRNHAWFQRRSHRETAQLVNLLWRQDASGAIKVNQGQSRSIKVNQGQSRSISHSGSCDKPQTSRHEPSQHFPEMGR